MGVWPLGNSPLGCAAVNIPGPPTGIGPQASWLARLADYVKTLEIKPGLGYRTKRSTYGTILEIDQRGGIGGAPLQISLYQFVSHGAGADPAGDYILCMPTTNPSATPIKILKPDLLWFSIHSRSARGQNFTFSGWDPVGQSRSATNNVGTVIQYITPSYAPGDFVWAMQVTFQTSPMAPSTNALMDLNINGRVFASP